MAGSLRRRVALVAIVGLALGLGASASANIDASHTARTVATAGDCDGNGVPDNSEVAWSNRDDDGDGFCNGIDVCPYEATAANDSSACQMQAITVPFDPKNLSKPHPTYSGASITLKGIARYGANQYSWDYGDGTAAMPWTPISDLYNLGVRHVYTGSTGQEFDATLSVRNSALPGVVASAAYPVVVEDGSDLSDPAQLDVRAEVAADEGLWWLHTHESRGRFVDGVPGENQNYGLWSQGMYTTCAALDALETHGSTPGSGWSDDPYVEDTQRALAYVLYNSSAHGIAVQAFGNPDVNGNGLGVAVGSGDDTYTNGVCAMALADSQSPDRVAATGLPGVYGRSYADLAQDAVDWFAYGQVDFAYGEGAWGYSANATSPNGETFRWPVFALDSAAKELGATVPPFVRQQIPYFLNYSHYTALDAYNGGWGWAAPNQYTSLGFTGAGIAIHAFEGDSPQHPDVVRGLGFLYRHWNDPPVNGFWGNLGDSDAMYTIARALHEDGLSRIAETTYLGAPTGNSFDWFHGTPVAGHQGYGYYLVSHQLPDGSFADAVPGAGTHGNGVQWSTAWDVIVLAMAPAASTAPTAPTASAGGPYTVAPGGSVTLDATGSSDPNGLSLAYAWDLSGNGLYSDSTSATPTFTAGNVPLFTVYPVCVKVTSSGGSATACTTVTVTGTAPIASAGGPYTVAPGGSVTLDATGTSNPDGLSLTYAWDLSGNGLYSDSTSATPTFTAGNVPAGTVYPVCVKVNSAVGVSTDCTTVTVVVIATPPVVMIVAPAVVNGPLPRDVTLDGSRSSGTAGDTLTYAWTVDDPDGTTTNATSAIATHTFHHYGTYTAHLLVSDGLLTSSADATVNVIDDTPPSLTVPGDIVLADGPTVTQEVNDWLASAAAVDDDPDHPQATIANDFTGVSPGSTVKVTWTATDSAGNTAQKSATVTVTGDTTPPTVTPVIDGTLGDNGWYTSDVHVTWQVQDPDSAVTPTDCGETDVTADTDTAGEAITCSATSAGGTTSDTIYVKRDATPPTIAAKRTPPANAAGWNSSDVTVTFTCDDALSGIAHCDTPTVLHEGASQSVTGTAIDNAGNHASAAVDGVNVDETSPSLSGAPTTPANVNGWYRGDVTIHWTCNDGLSGIDGSCPADSTIDGEGHALTVSESVADRAGNVTAAASPPVSIDRTPPVTTASAPSGWTNSGVTVTLAATDNLSGVAATYYSLDGAPTAVGTTVPIDAEGTHTITYWSVDDADNVEATRSIDVMIDKSAPTITHTLSPLPNAAGWNNTNVAVTFDCSDPLSGIAFCSPLQLLTGEGQALPVVGTATSGAGTTATDSLTVSIDKTPPTVQAAADRAPNAHGWYDADVVVSFTCDDGLSGVLACPAPVTLAEGSDQTASGSASDVAGNTTPASLGGIDVDETPPTVTYTGNAGAYTLGQNVAIHCAAADALSGIDTTTCADIVGPAASFGLGTTTRSATATDLAGNIGTGSVSFTVDVTCAGVKSLIAAWVTNSDAASGLSAKIDAICSAPTPKAKSGTLKAFDNQVSALTGAALTAEHAALLEQYAGAL